MATPDSAMTVSTPTPGRYFANRTAKESNKVSYDLEAAGRLRQVSSDLVGLPDSGR
ncbi:hypothetical protein [Agromyces bauzanensis]|uniref:Uncharacterized protein n=1 Tax=Agromyces bauzanensis TaxID=1308924 RepID=A0A917PLC9_9MICO|nr:hypothetical protein [Agromyces bauzanensis]GGJ82890.1 hypothetical protein GCM10011372_21480 [Agromyces bauzanensis]